MRDGVRKDGRRVVGWLTHIEHFECTAISGHSGLRGKIVVSTV